MPRGFESAITYKITVTMNSASTDGRISLRDKRVTQFTVSLEQAYRGFSEQKVRLCGLAIWACKRGHLERSNEQHSESASRSTSPPKLRPAQSRDTLLVGLSLHPEDILQI